MATFWRGQRVRIGLNADNAVGCLGRVLEPDDRTCEVQVEVPGGRVFTGRFLVEHLVPVTEDGRSLKDVHAEYEAILHSDLSAGEKDKAFAGLMTLLEKDFRVPALHNPEWEKKNVSVISLYRILSESRRTL